MRSFLTTSVLVGCLLVSCNAGPLKGSKKDTTPEAKEGKVANKKPNRELTFAPLIPGLFSLQTSFLSGDQEVPPIVVPTTGNIQVAFDEDFGNMAYSLYVDVGKSDDAADLVQAHFHCGSAGLNGPVFAFIYDASKDSEKVDKDGILKVEGLLTNADLVPGVDFAADSVCGKPANTIAAIYELIEARKVYVNVHSVANAGGEIRGQIFMKPKY
jgi:hypothetical protein